MSALSNPPKANTSIQRVAILFAGGPAPAANAVISTAAVSVHGPGDTLLATGSGGYHCSDDLPVEDLIEKL